MATFYNTNTDPNKVYIAGIGIGDKPVSLPIIPGISGLEQISINPYNKDQTGVQLATSVVTSYTKTSVFDGSEFGYELSGYYAFRLNFIPVNESTIADQRLTLKVYARAYPLSAGTTATWSEITGSVSRTFEIGKDILIPNGLDIFDSADTIQAWQIANQDLIFIKKTLLDIPNLTSEGVMPRCLVIRGGSQLSTMSDDFTSDIDYESIFSKGIEKSATSQSTQWTLNMKVVGPLGMWDGILYGAKLQKNRVFLKNTGNLSLTESTVREQFFTKIGQPVGNLLNFTSLSDQSYAIEVTPIPYTTSQFATASNNVTEFYRDIRDKTNTETLSTDSGQVGDYAIFTNTGKSIYIIDFAKTGVVFNFSTKIEVRFDNPLSTGIFYYRFGDISGIPSPTTNRKAPMIPTKARQYKIDLTNKEYTRDESTNSLYGYKNGVSLQDQLDEEIKNTIIKNPIIEINPIENIDNENIATLDEIATQPIEENITINKKDIDKKKK